MNSHHPSFSALLNRRPPTIYSQLYTSPLTTLAKALSSALSPAIPAPPTGIRVICISDTHNTQPDLPDGDILLHAGDLTQSGSLSELRSQIEWLDAQPHRYKVVIAGNHDLCLQASTEEIDWRSLIYLRDSATTLHFPGGRSLKIYGSPWTPKHGNWAFQYPRTGADPWEGAVPEDVDILLTHGPPRCHLDLDDLGCGYLLEEVRRREPILHVFGHIHAGYGKRMVLWDGFERAYEEAVGKGGSWWALGRMVFCVFSRLKGDSGRGTVMVNAAVVGGFRDEQRREAITVTI
ncbi:Metallo-dependent phosphatase [Glarea lozoyensis ATCC 20868]|uniref:Metallo-dependent phosphatase n=1 Tax=Glarea lozoyensis (strain ATCC 20868 / MF5171) TaxID=1116229 RepID=S3DT30_GLAL2|nr:Metallo-dependent phosphatase [Glarea lozoyensis ATCC 20868]EPE35126.1 Metallo-dependent phosphatase [Glarea lozoyensis ATCC 20868]